MRNAVIDTNVLVSALLSPDGAPSKVLDLVFGGQLKICYDSRILLEYKVVLSRQRFPFKPQDVSVTLNEIVQRGLSVIVPSLPILFTDESDKKFYEVANFCGAYLITGNLKHFPVEPEIMSPSELLRLIL